jgi:hypothetical protein
MTWRAFIVGLICVVGLNLLTPVNDFRLGNTFLTGNHFPVGAFCLLLLLTLGLNVAVKLVRRRWALRQAELLLVWCMLICGSTVPNSGLMRFMLPYAAAAPYYAQRPDYAWEDTVLKEARPGVLLDTGPTAVAARGFYEGVRRGEEVRVPWRHWMPYFATWGTFVVLYYLANFFLFGLLRRQWVERERLTFAVARVPMDLTQSSGGSSLLAPLLRSRPFLVGVCVTATLALLRVSPVLFGAEQGWDWRIPLAPMVEGTDWSGILLADAVVFPIAIGFAYLVPTDVSLSVWLFYAFACAEVRIADHIGRPMSGGLWSGYMAWQQAGAFMMFTVMVLWSARHHLWGVVRTALLPGGRTDDSDEPIRYRVGLWGLLLATAGMIAWYAHFGMTVWAALALLAVTLSVVVVHARVVAQGGLFFTQHRWSPPSVLHALSGGRIFGGSAALVATMQNAMMVADSREIFSPHAANALRISEVFRTGRRWFLPAMMAALLAAMVASAYSSLQWVYYDIGALNIKQNYGVDMSPKAVFGEVHTMISDPTQAEPQYWAMGIGATLMFALTMLRRTLYWWPVHSLGFAITTSYNVRELWFSFLLGWLIKVMLMKFAPGAWMRKARTFFVGVICTEAAVVGLTTLASLLTGATFGYIFLSE